MNTASAISLSEADSVCAYDKQSSETEFGMSSWEFKGRNHCHIQHRADTYLSKTSFKNMFSFLQTPGIYEILDFDASWLITLHPL